MGFANTGWWYVHLPPSHRRQRPRSNDGQAGWARGRSVMVGRIWSLRGVCAAASPFSVVERGDAVQRESEAGDPFEQPLEV